MGPCRAFSVTGDVRPTGRFPLEHLTEVDRAFAEVAGEPHEVAIHGVDRIVHREGRLASRSQGRALSMKHIFAIGRSVATRMAPRTQNRASAERLGSTNRSKANARSFAAEATADDQWTVPLHASPCPETRRFDWRRMNPPATLDARRRCEFCAEFIAHDRPAGAFRLRDMRVLIVEDYEPLRMATAKALREAGHAVDVAADGSRGLELGMGGQYDVIVLDLMLPGMDGLEVLRTLREEKVQSDVLLLTAKDTVQDRIRGLDSGADDYLVKPFDMDELLARTRALVRRRYERKTPIIEIGDLAVDTVARERAPLGCPRRAHRP